MSELAEGWQRYLGIEPDLDHPAMLLAELDDYEARHLPSALLGVAEAILDTFLVAPASTDRRAVVAPLSGHYSRAVEAAADIEVDSFDVLGIATTGLLLRSVGVDVEVAGPFGRHVGDVLRLDLSADHTTSVALAASALGFDDVVVTLLGPPGPFEPDLEFGPDAQSYARAVVAASAAGATFPDLAPAWRSLTAFFPLLFEAGGIQLCDLLSAAVAALVRVAHRSPGDVMDELHAVARELADG